VNWTGISIFCVQSAHDIVEAVDAGSGQILEKFTHAFDGKVLDRSTKDVSTISALLCRRQYISPKDFTRTRKDITMLYSVVLNVRLDEQSLPR